MGNPTLPRIYLVEQRFARPRVADTGAALRAGLEGLRQGSLPSPDGAIRPGQSVAIGVGSRGIRDIATVVLCLVDELKSIGATPFVVPAMGSHGGGTAEGQRAVLAGYGITEASMGCEVRATMDVVEVGRALPDLPVYLDRHAAEADRIVVVNRVKPHTKMTGPIESGLLKMCLIGLGKRAGAKACHRAIDRHGWMPVLEAAHEVLSNRARLAFGVAILQNAYEDIARLAVVPAEHFLSEEPRLLEQARTLVGRLPVDEVDLLVVDEMGKDISGTGMDTNVTGRKPGAPVRVVHLFVRGLTARSHGNAQGVGLADFVTRRLVDQIDFNAVYINSQTAYRTDTCKIPMTLATDLEVLQVAMDLAGVSHHTDFRLAWIRNTLALERVALSEAYAGCGAWHDLRVQRGPEEIAVDGEGNLVSPFSRSQDNEAA